MERLYSIGETARLMGISVQTLRNYSNLGLLKPQYVDEFTGYRYYSFAQFHYIDRIKYLRGLGLPLSDIEEILENGNTDMMVSHLDKQKERILENIEQLKQQLEDIEWYKDYFTYIQNGTSVSEIPYIKEFDTRYILYTDCEHGENVEDMETRLAKLKSNYSTSDYRRQYGYIADCKSLLKKQFVERKYFTQLKSNIHKASDSDNIMELKAGEYLCFRGRIRTDDWNPSIIAAYFRDKDIPEYAIALEYEDNLQSYHNCPYEVQVLINRK